MSHTPDDFATAIGLTQRGEEVRRRLHSSAESGYRPYPCPNCGRHRAYVCHDGMLRCEKCSLLQDASDEDLAAVFPDKPPDPLCDEMLAMLKELEWVLDDGCLHKCPSCGQLNPAVHGAEENPGHDPDCRLAALIAKAEGKAGESEGAPASTTE
jgi:predicted RNA-binding Zn-ribbon protein involved in translation (DUF1610 family)